MEEILARKIASPLIAPIIFIFVSLYHLFDKFLIIAKEKVSENEKDAELNAEIKQLLKEAAALSEPSTFAQSAKLRRLAAAKQRELSKRHDTARKDVRPLLILFEKMLPIAKVLTYILLIVCYWRTPVAAISKELVQPFGRFLSWKTGGPINNEVMVGIIPWVILSNRVSKYFVNKFYKYIA